jgi:hypothetical protein
VFAAQLTTLAGATVIGTGSRAASCKALRAEQVVRALAPGGMNVATDSVVTETVEVALALGVPPERISTITAGPSPPGRVCAALRARTSHRTREACEAGGFVRVKQTRVHGLGVLAVSLR